MLEMPAQLGNPDLLNDNLDAELNSPALDAIRAASYRGTKRKFRADEIKETAMNRLCNTKGSRWPAILEVTQDVLMLVERATGTVQAANSKYDELLATIGCGNSALGFASMHVHIVAQLQKMPPHLEHPYVYDSVLMGADGQPAYLHGTIIAPADDSEVVWSLHNVSTVVKTQQQMHALGQNFFHLASLAHNLIDQNGQNDQNEIPDTERTGSQSALLQAGPNQSAAVALPTSEVPTSLMPQLQQTGADWQTWFKPKSEDSEAPKPKSRRPYRFCSKCWLKSGQWVLRSIKTPDGGTVNLNQHTNDACPQWPDMESLPTAQQTRAYGTAFKRAQRGEKLYEIAFSEFAKLVPDMSPEALKQYLTG